MHHNGGAVVRCLPDPMFAPDVTKKDIHLDRMSAPDAIKKGMHLINASS
ncbi:MAG: hypothetical protein WBH63_05890 [Bacillota bacterium]|jgi:hypothetical protein